MDLIERLGHKVRRRDLETGSGWADGDGKGGFKSNGEVWQQRNPDGPEALAEITRLQSLLEEARRVVEPFAEAEITGWRSGPSPRIPYEIDGLTDSDFRAARSFIDKLDRADGR